MLSLKVYTKSIATVYIITYSTFDVVIVDNVMITDFSRKLLQFNAVGELCASSKTSSVRWFLYYRPRHQTLGPIPPLCTDIWWLSLETCSHLFIWGPTPHSLVLISSGGHRPKHIQLLKRVAYNYHLSKIAWIFYHHCGGRRENPTALRIR